MKKLLLSVASMAIITSLPVNADKKQVVTISGQATTQSVKTITFSGDNLELTFSDGSTQTVDMADVTIAFTIVDAIKTLDSVKQKDAPVMYFDLGGHQLKQAPKSGAFILKKGDKVVKIVKK
ncbi:MAG: hypothetical protein IJP74_10950 [Prevotella sp.]|nr:hypothetical protein [Prevotella sp.]